MKSLSHHRAKILAKIMDNEKALHVEILKEGGQYGEVSDPDTIYYNVGQIDPSALENLRASINSFGVGTLIRDAGKYVCIVTMATENRNTSMIIHDLDNDEKRAKSKLQVFRTNDMSDRFMKAFRNVAAKDDNELNEFYLTLGKVPK